MITIVSGVPGSGKTAYIMERIMLAIRENRKVFTAGIPSLILKTHEAGDVQTWQTGKWLSIDFYNPGLTKKSGIRSNWFPRGCSPKCPFLSTCPRIGQEEQNLDRGAVLIIDEAHTDFPQRASGKLPPPHVEALTVHRQQGLDIIFITQKPNFLDPFVRDLASEHIHFSLNPFSFSGGRNKYIWSEYQATISRATKLLAAKSTYFPSPSVFGLYHSSSLHTKLDRHMPTIQKVLILVLVCLFFVLIGIGFYLKSRYQTVMAPVPVPRSAPALNSSPSLPLPPPAIAGEAIGGERSAPAASPAIAAPPVFIGACIASAFKCACFTRVGVPVPMSEADCRISALHPTSNFFPPVEHSLDVPAFPPHP